MREPSGASLGQFLGTIAVLGGGVWTCFGFVCIWRGQVSEAVEGFVFGGLAIVAGCAILYRRSRMAGRKQDAADPAGPDAAADRPGD